MPLFTVAGSASLLGSKTARVCFHQLSFPTFSDAEVLLILFLLSFQLKPGEGASEVLSKNSQQADADSASQGRDSFSRTTSLYLNRLLCTKKEQALFWQLLPLWRNPPHAAPHPWWTK